ncbi:hypothetical protein HMPREF0975_02752, partial [Actinomyces sp. oral taxon 849 str. F0330]|uniref:glycosyltransferase family 2 protein n=1 Tax=Actinomyces sp. oral taxon 849 TaxID=653385 RepID=UPI000243054F
MSRLTIAIPTFRRPEDLKRAISGVLGQAVEQAGGEIVSDVEVLVIDNDAPGSAREAALAAAADAAVVVRTSSDEPMEPGSVSVRYVVEERPGVAAVRNRALDETPERDLLIFIDDDEEPEPGWLAALVGMRASTGCQAVAGPVIPVYEVEPEEWVRQGEFFVRKTWPTGTIRPVAASNCLLLDLGFVRRKGLRFDEAFGADRGRGHALHSPVECRRGRHPLVRRGARARPRPGLPTRPPLDPAQAALPRRHLGARRTG